MAYTVVIPARMASTRLPDKPLADIHGLPMIVRVAQQAHKSQAMRTVVAADDEKIVNACRMHGVEAIMTRPDHPSGSDRLAEASQILKLADDAIVVNVQGDEPLIDPALIDAVAALLQASAHADMGTAAHPIATPEEFDNPNVVKVILSHDGCAQYFSRAAIPHARGQQGTTWWRQAGAAQLHAPLRHVGIYSYRAAFLRRFPTLPVAPTEATESLEQLRALWHGCRIGVHVAPGAPSPGVDTPEDLERVRALWRAL
ncbi:3-deoxy-manno-octulosonate cytidylyltransferase [Ramlibacter sp. H39-3-26]|uniref:3-deoxy-manno-octulosonate cytidylyltransferase n=1 Tax=Curvibacter soli TaxID=3031331 RepID=UPI0023DA3F23|nr:3-deoxy-manno-octulosonate cytidylyltransferase [Ramlibacter sp. H39-3-26]MDF1483799.1 3-deoxy-manno-octulosonate cytidylyltransferase [Ramlibacter sp. H39-3-26]